MSTRVTRRSAVKEPSSVASDKEDHLQQPAAPVPLKANAKATAGSKAKSSTTTPKVEAEANGGPELPLPATRSQPSKKKTAKKEETPETKPDYEGPTLSASAAKKRKRPAAAPKVEEDPNELPHNMGKRPLKRVKVKGEAEGEGAATAKTGSQTKSAMEKSKLKDAKSMVDAASVIDASETSPKKKTKKAAHFPYSDPYPDWEHPTPEECQVVHDLLMNAFPEDQHSRFIQPDTIPPPSEFVAGCGEVPTILDAMLRTLLSAATSKTNSSRAFQGLVKRFGLQESGPCKGSVDWTAMRHATTDDVFQAIKTGGLADNKSRDIKAILDIVYSENAERCKAHAKVIENHDPSAAPEGADPQNLAQMKGEIDLFEQDILTLDYYHLLSKDDALTAMQKYPGIGVKTAACVVLFCMQKPCFAVDTHVFRLCRYLGWVPPKDEKVAQGKKKRPKLDEVSTFKHCELRIPENLKYGLHQLFWDHGNHCGRCRAITGQTSEGWADANCPIEHLVKRHGEKKGGANPLKKSGKATKGKGGKKLDSDGDGDDEDMADVGDENIESGEDEDDYSPTKRKQKTKASPAKKPTKLGKVATATAMKAGTAGKGAVKAGKASKAKSGKKVAKGRSAVEVDQDRETSADAEVDNQN